MLDRGETGQSRSEDAPTEAREENHTKLFIIRVWSKWFPLLSLWCTSEKKDSAGQTICDEWSFPRITSNTCFIFQELTFNVIISFSSLFFVLTGSFLFLFVKQLHHILKTTRGALHLLLKPVLLTEKWASLKTKVNKYDETKSSTNTLCPLMWRNNQIKKTLFSPTSKEKQINYN